MINASKPKSKIRKRDFKKFLSEIEPGSVDLILTDPPYAISRKTGFSCVGPKSVKRFAVSMDFGEWDNNPIDLEQLSQDAYRILRPGGTVIIFYDLWKITTLHNALVAAKFKQLRLIEWLKSNPVPLNSSRNYLTNSREIAVLAVKGGKPTFNSSYDNGQYIYPIPREKRYHPTQKPLKLMNELVLKHSSKGDVIVDPFLGSGTTGVAAIQNQRIFLGCDINKKYVDIARSRIRI